MSSHEHVARRFAAVCVAEDVASLVAVLASDVVAVCDGGGQVCAPAVPVWHCAGRAGPWRWSA
jgi:hypothetical protein